MRKIPLFYSPFLCLKDSLKEKTFFKDLRKEVETGANGTQDYVVKKGVNKDSIATTKQ